MRVLSSISDERDGERFTAELESALLAQALFATGSLPDERAKALLSAWLRGIFNATVVDLRSIGADPAANPEMRSL